MDIEMFFVSEIEWIRKKANGESFQCVTCLRGKTPVASIIDNKLESLRCYLAGKKIQFSWEKIQPFRFRWRNAGEKSEFINQNCVFDIRQVQSICGGNVNV